MIKTLLAAMVFFNMTALSKEDNREMENLNVKRVDIISSHLPLSPDALDRIYDATREEHRFFIARKKDMPNCLRDLEGPFPFYGHSVDARLGTLITDYFASLQFDNPDVQKEAEKMRLMAINIQDRDPIKAVELLYKAGWKMGDPLSVSMLVTLLIDLRGRGSEYIAEESNLASILDTYPKTISAVVQKIKSARGAVDYRHRKTCSETFRTESEEELAESEISDGDDKVRTVPTERSFLIETRKKSEVRRRK
jgi:hypothetical protein